MALSSQAPVLSVGSVRTTRKCGSLLAKHWKRKLSYFWRTGQISKKIHTLSCEGYSIAPHIPPGREINSEQWAMSDMQRLMSNVQGAIRTGQAARVAEAIM